MYEATLLLNSSAQTYCPGIFQSGIWCCSLGVPWILDPRSVSPTENPQESTNGSGKSQKFPWAVLPWD